MIRRIEIENFMCLRNVAVDLEPLTVFIGPNASGKSAIFKALVTLSKLLSGAPVRGTRGGFSLEPGVAFDELVWNGNSTLPIRFRVWFSDDGDEPGYSLELSKGQAGWSVSREKIRTSEGYIEVDENSSFEHPTERRGLQQLRPPLQATLRYRVHPFLNDSAARPVINPIIDLSEKFGTAWRYRPSAGDIASFVKYPSRDEPGPPQFVAANGFGMARELQNIQGSKRSVFEAIEQSVCRLFPHIKSIGFETDWQGVRLAFMTDRSGKPIPAPQESDGVLLATFLFWRLHTGDPMMKVCLEEPENGLHPVLLAERFAILKQFAYPQDDQSPVQLLVSTHSPEFLRAVKAHPKELWQKLRIVEHEPTAGTSVRSVLGFREATKLIDEHLDKIHEQWGPVIRSWST